MSASGSPSPPGADPGSRSRGAAEGRARQESSHPPRLRWAGTEAFLLELGHLDEVRRWHAHLTEHPFPGQVDVVAAASTVMVLFAGAHAARVAANDVGHVRPDPSGTGTGRTVEIPVVYDGTDLAEVARLTGMSEHGVVETHTGATWTAAFGGFAPGFAYLTAAGDPLDVPRRDTPRTAVPAGTVALAGTFSATYPQRSPGGWQLIGHTDAVLWDVHRDPPALIRPGDTVRYRAVRELVAVASAAAGGPDPAPESTPPAHGIVVDDPGLQTLVQDLGRPGLGDLGVTVSGAADRAAAAQSNRLVGNDAQDALLETTLGGLSLTARGHHVLALAGAPLPGAVVDGAGRSRPVPFCQPFALYDGEQLTLGAAAAGLRGYVAVRGGLAVPAVLGSRSTDVLSGIGPAALATGDVLPVHRVTVARGVGRAETPQTRVPSADEVAVLRIHLGPRDDWFTPQAVEALTARPWRVSSESNRVGVRFEPPDGGSELERSRTGELASEGVAAGSLQVPHSGSPVLFLADHPVTGGYPVIAVVEPEGLSVAAQLPPGAAVQFRVLEHPAPAADR